MELYTVQLGQWRLCKTLSIPMIDTTVRSGDLTFAPTWEMVLASKGGTLSQEDYTEQYLARMRVSLKQNEARWLEVARLECCALACYYKAGAFCHRRILAQLFEKVCLHHDIPYVFKGELTKKTLECTDHG